MPAYRLRDAPPFESRKPRYMVLAEAISQSIESGAHPVGSLLPTEAELCARHQASRHTVREATRVLQDLGLVTRRQGVGTQVLAAKVATRYVLALDAIPELWEYAKTTELKVLRKLLVRADRAALPLPGDAGHQWWLIEALRLGKSGSPLAWSQLYFDSIYGRIAGQIGRRRAPIYALIEQAYGVKVVRVKQEISSLAIPAPIARLLRVKPASPGLAILRHYHDADDRIFEATRTIYSPGEFRYSIELHLEYGNKRHR